MIDALEQCDAQEFDPLAARGSALRFSRERFLLEFGEFVAYMKGCLTRQWSR